jgi:phosphoribosylanthranilate isomerase
MFRLKICGITNETDARLVAEAGADAIGLNFFSKSRRFVAPSRAREIAAALPPGVWKVGVFVNHSTDQIGELVETIGLDCIQLHGDEPAAILSRLPSNTRLVRAFQCGESGLAPLARYLEDCRSHGRVPDAVLIDADAGGDFGGSGRRADWTRIAKERSLAAPLPVILAGGLTPDTVAEAIRITRPDGVDVASGVEDRPGCKSAALIRQFVAEARSAFSRSQSEASSRRMT